MLGRYRLAEIFYRRGGRSTETVVLYLPDTAALAPPRVAWERTTATYRQQLQTKLNPAAAPASDDKARCTAVYKGPSRSQQCVSVCVSVYGNGANASGWAGAATGVD